MSGHAEAAISGWAGLSGAVRTSRVAEEARTETVAQVPAPRPGLRLERRLLAEGAPAIVGVDEVGRGSLAGPVTVGMVLLAAPLRRVPAGLADSKLLSASARTRLRPIIERWAAAHAVAHASAAEVNDLGIMAALCLAGQRAYASLLAAFASAPVPGAARTNAGSGFASALGAPAVILDGNYDWLTRPAAQRGLFDPPGMPTGIEARVRTQVKADLGCASVAAASVLAKVERDQLMTELARTHPGYGWDTNAGYGTPAHRRALRELGLTPYHRKSWNLVS